MNAAAIEHTVLTGGKPDIDRIHRAQERLTCWWDHTLNDPIFDIILTGRPDAPRTDPNRYWPDAACNPDFHGVAREHVRALEGMVFAGDALPHLSHLYGARGTPMTSCFYSGADVEFRPDMVWVKPGINDLSHFNPVFNPDNHWLTKSLALFDAQCSEGRGTIMPCIPGIGDALTSLSLMRGAAELSLDLIDCPAEVHRVRDRMTDNFLRFYKLFEERYQPQYAGTVSWLAWAPGPTYPVQCDFSTMISPEMFREFVVPELSTLATHLTHMAWHLDGEEELQHLDTLLAIPEIKAIQWVPHAGIAEAYLPKWYPLIRRILDAGKGFHGMATIAEAEAALDDLPHNGLYLRIRDRATEENIARLDRSFGITLCV